MTDNAFSWLPGGSPSSDDEARDAFEQNKAMEEAAKLIQREKAKLFHDVFGVGRGPELLELLRSETIELDLMNISRVIGTSEREVPVNPSEWAYHRNGQNSVVRYIEHQIMISRLVETEENPNV